MSIKASLQSRKHRILFKTSMDLKKRFDRGETISYNFPLKKICDKHQQMYQLEVHVKVSPVVTKAQVQKRQHKIKMSEQEFKLPAYESDDDEFIADDLEDFNLTDDDFDPHNEQQPADEDEVFEEPKKAPKKKKTGLTGNKRGRRPKTAIWTDEKGQGQTSCCVKTCSNPVTNRLRFSLRCKGPDDFKEGYLEKGWSKICHACYFSDLYRFKKQNREAEKNGEKPADKKAAGKKRKRQNQDSAPKKRRKTQQQDNWLVD